MIHNDVETGFQLLDESTQILKDALDTSFLDAYLENGENILDEFQVRVLDGVPDEATQKKIAEIYQKMQRLSLEPEDIRKVTQLVLLKGTMKDGLQPNHQLTPDAIGFIFVYMIEELLQNKELRILDPAVGMGNLLLTLLLNLKIAKYQVTGYGVDIDETLLEIAGIDSQFVKEEVTLFHQDCLQPLLLDPVDVVVSDLPVGFYPDDQQAQKFLTNSSEGHTYAHHLLIEQSMNYLKAGGFGLYLVPTNLFETEQTKFLTAWLKENAYLQGFVHLPKTLFKSEQSRKSILILQKQGDTSSQAPEVLLGEISSLKDLSMVQKFFQQFKNWKIENIK